MVRNGMASAYGWKKAAGVYFKRWRERAKESSIKNTFTTGVLGAPLTPAIQIWRPAMRVSNEEGWVVVWGL